MSPPRLSGRSPFVRLTALCVGTPLLLAAAEAADNAERLLSMPPARRLELSKVLDRFDALPRTEREAIRELDRRIESITDPVQRAQYRSVMHRYRLWLESLGDEERARVLEAAPDQRIAVIDSILKARGASAPRAKDGARKRPDPPWIQATNLVGRPAVDQAYWIRIWLIGLTPEQRKLVQKAPPAARIARLEQLGRQNGVPDDRAGRYREEIEALGPAAKVAPVLKKAAGRVKGNPQVDRARRWAESLYLNKVPTAPVSPQNMERFVAAVPDWLLEPLDALPPDAARARTAAVYRMIFPVPEEMPEIKPEPKDEKPKSAAPAPKIAPPGSDF